MLPQNVIVRLEFVATYYFCHLLHVTFLHFSAAIYIFVLPIVFHYSLTTSYRSLAISSSAYFLTSR
jgi:hypothetical protein